MLFWQIAEVDAVRARAADITDAILRRVSCQVFGMRTAQQHLAYMAVAKGILVSIYQVVVVVVSKGLLGEQVRLAVGQRRDSLGNVRAFP